MILGQCQFNRWGNRIVLRIRYFFCTTSYVLFLSDKTQTNRLLTSLSGVRERTGPAAGDVDVQDVH